MVGASLYLARPPTIRRITTPLPAFTAMHCPVVIENDFDHEAITQVEVEVEVNLSQLEHDTIPCGPPRPQVVAGAGYFYYGSKTTDIDLLISFMWKEGLLQHTGTEEYVGEAYIYGTLHYVWRRDNLGQFVAQCVPRREL